MISTPNGSVLGFNDKSRTGLNIYRSKATVNQGMADGAINMEQFFQGTPKYFVDDGRTSPQIMNHRKNATIVVRQPSGLSAVHIPA